MSKKFLEIWKLGKIASAIKRSSSKISASPFAKGEFVSLIGHSGCGKSTVLSMVAGLTHIDEGGMILDGREVDGPGPDRGVVFQSPCLFPWMTAVQNVMLGVGAKSPESRARGAPRHRRLLP